MMFLGTAEHGFYKEAAALVAQAIPKNKCVIIPKKYATVPALKPWSKVKFSAQI